ncbi:[FeFe] hydrogenase H-cluster radical SAM maturase HydE [Oleidesulfovibrio sp.]|uniref:[FeFe] hydrogenase H-cluster radical SAM maturase HydE n=1 Tax=Oleidesulfovibrio sp. TaxID=2909707 RepID=UPI003A8537EE
MNINEIMQMLAAPDAEALYADARSVTDAIFGKSVYVRGVVEFSNYCKKNCHYCGLRAANVNLERFRLHAEDIYAAAALAVELGAGTIVLQSGEDLACDVAFIGSLVRRIKDTHDVAITLSVGDHDRDTYAFWRDCGADRYLLKIETTDIDLHERLRPGSTVEDRLARVQTLQELGYETGSGIIVGLPGMTDEIIAKDLKLLSSLGLGMIAAGPFIPHPQTPLAAPVDTDIEKSLRVTAMLRLLNKGSNIPATSALDALVADGRIRGLAAGANVVMPSVTPDDVRGGYSIYPGKNTAGKDVQDAVLSLMERLRTAGYRPVAEKGFSKLSETAS